MCSVVQYPSTAACSRGCSPLVGAGQWPWPPMTSGAPVLQYPVRSWLSSTCHVSCVTCDVLQSDDVEMWREAIKLCSSSPQHSYLLTIENMRCWETAVGETLRQWDWAEPEMRREILYLGAGVRGSVASVWRLLSVTWWRDVTPTWRFNDSLQRNLSHPKVWTSILFLFSATGQVQRVIVLKPIKLDYRSAAAQLGGGWSSQIVTSMYSTALSHHPSRPFWTSIPI